MHRYGAIRQWQVGVVLATNLMDLVPTVFPVLLTDAHLTIELAARYSPQGVRARDLLHVAVMQNNGLTEIISADAHFDRIEGILRLDPQDLFQRASGRPT